MIAFHQTKSMINIFNKNYILICYVCQVIFNCYKIPSSDEIVTKDILLSKKRPFNFSHLLLFTCGINILFFIFLGIFTDLISTLFISSYYMFYGSETQKLPRICSKLKVIALFEKILWIISKEVEFVFITKNPSLFEP